MPAQDLLRHIRPLQIMSVICQFPFPDSTDAGHPLPHIMKKCCPAIQYSRRSGFQYSQCMVPPIKFVKFLLLRQPHKMRQFRQNRNFLISSVFLHTAALGCKPASYHKIEASSRMRRNDKLIQFLPYPFQRQTVHPGKCRGHSCYQRRICQEIQLSQKAASPEKAECILRKPFRGRAYCIKPLFPDSLSASEKINQNSLRRKRHGVDRKIPALQILFQGIRKGNSFRPMSIFPVKFLSIRSNLKSFAAERQNHRSETPAASIHGFPAFLRRGMQNFLRPCRCRNIPVMRFLSHQKVSYASADQKGFPAFFLQSRKHGKSSRIYPSHDGFINRYFCIFSFQKAGYPFP